jgi:hypothetical protein
MGSSYNEFKNYAIKDKGIKMAAKELNMSRSSVKYRLNSKDDKYKTWYKL